jgi:hypothetical protein
LLCLLQRRLILRGTRHHQQQQPHQAFDLGIRQFVGDRNVRPIISWPLSR